MGGGTADECRARAKRTAEVWREVDSFRRAYPNDAAEWMNRYGLNPEMRPKFAAGTDAVRRLADAAGMSQAALARALGKAPATVSGWAKRPEDVRPANVRAVVDAAAEWCEMEWRAFVRLVQSLMDGPSLPANADAWDVWGQATADAWTRAVSEAWRYLTNAQRAAAVETLRAMVASNGGPLDLFADCGDAPGGEK